MANNNLQSTQELKTLFKEADLRLELARKQLDELSMFIELFKETEENIKELKNFYHGPVWIEGREKLFELFPDEHYLSAGEDSIWDIAQEMYIMKVRFIKTVGDSLLDELSESADEA